MKSQWERIALNPPAHALQIPLISRVAGPALVEFQSMENPMIPIAEMMILGAAGWAFLVWLCGGGFGLAIVVFIVLKLLGK